MLTTTLCSSPATRGLQSRSVSPLLHSLLLLNLQVKSSRDWVDILDFTAPRKFPLDEVTYHLRMLWLFSELCAGRNQAAIQILSGKEIGMTYEEAFWCVRNKFLDPAFRAAYCDILLNVFVDVFPSNPQKTAFRKVNPDIHSSK